MSSITPEWGVPRLSLVQLLLLKLLVLLLPPVVCHLPRGRQRRPSARTHVSLPPNYFLLPILTLIILHTRTHAYARPSTQYVIQKTQCAMRQCSYNEKVCEVYPRPLLSLFQLNKKVNLSVLPKIPIKLRDADLRPCIIRPLCPTEFTVAPSSLLPL